MLFIVINCLSKQLYLIPYYKTINTYNITKLFLSIFNIIKITLI
jgi:hypothetical protein